jgi:hypothetical protein
MNTTVKSPVNPIPELLDEDDEDFVILRLRQPTRAFVHPNESFPLLPVFPVLLQGSLGVRSRKHSWFLCGQFGYQVIGCVYRMIGNVIPWCVVPKLVGAHPLHDHGSEQLSFPLFV